MEECIPYKILEIAVLLNFTTLKMQTLKDEKASPGRGFFFEVHDAGTSSYHHQLAPHSTLDVAPVNSRVIEPAQSEVFVVRDA